MSSLDPTPCNETVLAEQAAQAQQTQNPVPPYPTFYSSGQCKGNVGSSFPLYFFSVNCQTDPSKQDTEGVPPPQNNCLRVISDLDGTFDPLNGPALLPSQVNVLPGGKQKDNSTPANNVFFDAGQRLYSFYVPPQYKIVFYAGNPMATDRKTAAAAGYLEIGGDQLMVDACLSGIALSNGQPFFVYKNLTGFPPCFEAYCSCGTGQTLPVSTFCGTSTKSVDCPGVEHRAPYFIVVKTQEFSDIIQEMCADNRPVSLGTSINSLNRVWKPQADGCDTFMTNLCKISNLEDSDYAEICSCFTQQQNLNNQYGVALDVPVCCFGTDASDPGDITKSCAFNTNAYKTGAMLKNCCSFAECQQVVDQSSDMQAKASPAGQVQCDGSFVQFPVPARSPDGPLPSVTVDKSDKIPIYVWIIFVTSVLLLLLFVISLAFV